MTPRPVAEPSHPERVWVLMSTYNGAPYVAAQLRSILEQLPPGGQVVVRDDGSKDQTVSEVQALKDTRVTLQQGTNLGFAASFLTLLSHVPADVQMVMFADQDDVWLPGKIDRAWRHLQRLGASPGLYGSTQMLTDPHLQPLHATRTWLRPPSFCGALAENMITGCTAALNAPAVRLMQRAGVPEGVYFHDWWLYLVVSSFGQVVFDPEPTLLYRQHGNNQIGHGAGWLGRHHHIARFLLRHDWVGILLGQVRALWHHYGDDLPASSRQLVLDHFCLCAGEVRPRWRLILGLRRWRDSMATELAFRLLLLLHRLRVWPPQARRLRLDAA
jgi:glycosyltransferase involved in cell wall biosynthesis